MYLCTRCEFNRIDKLTTLELRRQMQTDSRNVALYCYDCNSNTDHLPIYEEIRSE